MVYLPNYDENYAQFETIDAKGIIKASKNPEFWKDGIRVFIGKNHETNVKVITKYFTNGLIIYEEANGWFNLNGAVQKWQLVVFSQNRHRGVDIYICLHGLMDIPKSIRSKFAGFFLFESDSPIPSAKFLSDNGFPGDAEVFFQEIQKANSQHESGARMQYVFYFDAEKKYKK